MLQREALSVLRGHDGHVSRASPSAGPRRTDRGADAARTAAQCHAQKERRGGERRSAATRERGRSRMRGSCAMVREGGDVWWGWMVGVFSALRR